MKVQAMVKLRSRGIHGRKLIILCYSCVKNVLEVKLNLLKKKWIKKVQKKKKKLLQMNDEKMKI